MKKLLTIFLTLLIFGLVACQAAQEEGIYTDDLPFTIEMTDDDLNILQLTDLHLTYGIDSNDRKTLSLIDDLVDATDVDLIVISGDMMMSISAPSLFSRLIRHMESLKTPWTFVFGNHETDYTSYETLLHRIGDTEYLYFKVGPEMADGGYGNFVIQFTKDSVPFYNVYLMDSHNEMKEYTEEQGEYGYVSVAQVDWYQNHVESDTVDSVMFMHIPLRQMMNPVDYVGIFNEDKVYAQGVDTGLFDQIVDNGKTTGVFVGHDHLNDFYLMKDGVMLAYGQITGYNAYGDLERGGRVIHIDSDGVMSSYIVLESEVTS